MEGKTTIQDVRSVVEKAKEKYESSSTETNARRYLRIFSARIMYYGQVFDMLSQHHPEYVALAWGSVKFVLMVGQASFCCAIVGCVEFCECLGETIFVAWEHEQGSPSPSLNTTDEQTGLG